MTDTHDSGNIGAGTEGARQPRRTLFTITGFAALILIPAAAIAAIIITVILQPSFYTSILKDGRFITAFVQGKNWQTEKRVNDEIESELQLTSYTQEFEAIKKRHEEAKADYLRTSRDDELESLEKQHDDLNRLKWKELKETFPNREDFESNRKEELQAIKGRIREIEEYQKENSDLIKTARAAMKKAEDEYEDAVSILEDKKRDAEKIAEKHRDTGSGKLYADLKLIEKPLSGILNEKLIDGAVRGEIEKALDFVTSYDEQVQRRNIFYRRDMGAEQFGSRTLVVKFPDFDVSLWVDDASGAAPRKRHVMSDLLVEKLADIDDLQNRTLLMTVFRFSDTGLGEHFAGKYLRNFGLSINSGVIHVEGPVFEGDKAETISNVMAFLSWGRYAAYGAALIPLLYIFYLIFSTAERRLKLVALKRLLIYPPVIVLAACGALLWASRNIFSFYPDIVEDLAVRSYAKHLSFVAAWHFIAPLCIVFGLALLAGLILRRYLAATG